jgi:hypothetical protein
VQEFKTGNPKLVARLSEPDAIKATRTAQFPASKTFTRRDLVLQTI